MGGFDVDDPVIRSAKRSDEAALARLWSGLITYHKKLDKDLPNAARNGDKRYAARLVDRLHDPEACVLVAEVDGEVIGFVLGMVVNLVPDVFAQERCGFLADIYVDEAHRRHGVGRALVRAVENWFQQTHNLSYYEWHVAAQNTAGRAFWQSMNGRDIMVRMRARLEDTE